MLLQIIGLLGSIFYFYSPDANSSIKYLPSGCLCSIKQNEKGLLFWSYTYTEVSSNSVR